MSEYQYYEFRAIDRPLDAREMKMLRGLSTRAEITSTSFVNTYNWGDFKDDPDTLMETHFDAFVYVTNWGVRRLVFRLPKTLLRPKFLSACCKGESLKARKAGDFTVIEFSVDNGPPEWEEEGEGWMTSLIGLRADLARGDDRCLYLGWLLNAQFELLDADTPEPPVPPGLRSMSGSLEALADFLCLDPNLLEVAASVREEPPARSTRAEVAAFVQNLPAKEKDALLVAAAYDLHSRVGAEILRRFELARTVPETLRARRTVGELLAAADQLAAEKHRMSEERAAEQRAREEKKAAKVRAAYLDQLAEREDATWNEVHSLIQTKQPGKYDLAVQLLIDLRDLATRSNEASEFHSAVQQLRQVHAAKPSFLRRISDAGL